MAQYEYTLGAAGERTAVKELNRTVEYTYDALYRLTSEKIAAADGTVTAYAYAYDKVSNRFLKTENGAETVYTYNALNQLTAENDITYAYDAAGNLIFATSTTKSTLYVYNAENKLIRATVQEGNDVTVEEYTYDYAGCRTSKSTTVNGVTEYVKYLNDNSALTNVLAEINTDGNEICYYTIGADLISQERSSEISYYLYDGHGTVRGLVNDNGEVTDTYAYDAFGNLLDKTGTTVNNYLYCGEQFDFATGLYYLRARYMNPATGTFITQDTYAGTIFDPTSLHKYLYANANPVMNCDPSGYCVATLYHETEYNINVIQIGRQLIAQLRGLTVLASNALRSGAITEVVESVLMSGCITTSIIAEIAMFNILYSASSQVISYVTGLNAIDIEAEKDNILKQKYCYVYLLREYGTDNVMYVGIASDPKRRAEQHKKDERKKTDGVSWRMDVIIKAKNRIQARMIEEALITAFTLEKLANARHEIRSGRVENESKFSSQLKDVQHLLNNIAEEDLMWLIA